MNNKELFSLGLIVFGNQNDKFMQNNLSLSKFCVTKLQKCMQCGLWKIVK
jgi:hypothetical protein